MNPTTIDTTKTTTTIEEKKEETIMKPVTNETTMIEALIEGGIPKAVAEDIGLVHSITDMRKYVETSDLEMIKIVRNVGNKRAEKICEILKDRIPAVMSKPCPDVKNPDVEMHKVAERTLTMENRLAVFSPWKYKFGEKVMKNGEPVRNIAMKRFGPALQKLQQIADKKDGIVFTTVSEIMDDYKDPIKTFELQAKWHNAVKNGIKMPGGELWVPGIMGTNARMKSQIHWIQLKNSNALRTWMKCGANFDGKKVNVAKTEAYFGLLLPYTKKLLDNRLNPDHEVLIPEWENEHKGDCMLIEPDGAMKKLASFVVSEFDGMLVIDISEELIDKMNLTRPEKRRLQKAIAKFKGGTLRAPWHKGMIVVGPEFREMLRDMGVTEIDGKPLDDIAMFGDMSVFKASIGDNCLYEKFEDFAVSFKQLQHRYGVLLENHGIKDTFLPAQQLQAAHGCDPKFVEQGAEMEVEYLKAAQDPKVAAIRYEPKSIAKVAQEDATIMSTWFASEMAINGYTKELQHAMSGRTHGVNKTGFVIKDLVAFAQWIAYYAGVRKELPTGCLGKYKVYAPEAGITGPAVASRNPVIANYGLVEVEVVDTLGEYDKYFPDGFNYIMVGIHDDLCKKLRMDHDGDKMRLSFDEWFINANRSIKQSGMFAEWYNFGEVVKEYYTDENRYEYYGTCTTSPSLGRNVDLCGKIIANGLLTTEEQNMVADYMMNKGTDVKQGADGANVEGEAGVIWKEMRMSVKDEKMSKAMAYGKMLKDRAPKADDVMSEAGDSNLDIIYKAVKEKAPKALNYAGPFDVRKVMYGNKVQVPGLVGNWYNRNTGTFERGLFDEQVSRNKETWSLMDENAKTVGLNEFLAWQKQEVMNEYKAFAEEKQVSMTDIYDTITLYIFVTLGNKWNQIQTKIAQVKKNIAEETVAEKKDELKAMIDKHEKTKSWYIVLARTYLQWFGNMMEDVFCTNMDLGFLPAVDQPEEVDEDFAAC